MTGKLSRERRPSYHLYSNAMLSEPIEIDTLNRMSISCYSSLNIHRPPFLIASNHLSSTSTFSCSATFLLSSISSCVVGKSILQNPGGVVCLSYACLCLPTSLDIYLVRACRTNSFRSGEDICVRLVASKASPRYSSSNLSSSRVDNGAATAAIARKVEPQHSGLVHPGRQARSARLRIVSANA